MLNGANDTVKAKQYNKMNNAGKVQKDKNLHGKIEQLEANLKGNNSHNLFN